MKVERQVASCPSKLTCRCQLRVYCWLGSQSLRIVPDIDGPIVIQEEAWGWLVGVHEGHGYRQWLSVLACEGRRFCRGEHVNPPLLTVGPVVELDSKAQPKSRCDPR